MFTVQILCTTKITVGKWYKNIFAHRTIELPFVPYEGLNIFCSGWEAIGEEMKLTDISWDMERQLFVAKIQIADDWSEDCKEGETEQTTLENWHKHYMLQFREENWDIYEEMSR